MKRLIKKEALTATDVEIGWEVELQEDPKYERLDMHDLSLPENRDGVLLVDVKDKKIYWGLNGETHADLLEKYYNIPLDSNETYLDIDDYVASGIYLKDFLGQESVIMYSTLPGVEDIIKNEKPNVYVYEDNIFDGTLIRIATKLKKK